MSKVSNPELRSTDEYGDASTAGKNEALDLTQKRHNKLKMRANRGKAVRALTGVQETLGQDAGTSYQYPSHDIL